VTTRTASDSVTTRLRRELTRDRSTARGRPLVDVRELQLEANAQPCARRRKRRPPCASITRVGALIRLDGSRMRSDAERDRHRRVSAHAHNHMRVRAETAFEEGDRRSIVIVGLVSLGWVCWTTARPRTDAGPSCPRKPERALDGSSSRGGTAGRAVCAGCIAPPEEEAVVGKPQRSARREGRVGCRCRGVLVRAICRRRLEGGRDAN